MSFSFLLLFKTKVSLAAELEDVLLKNATDRALTKAATISSHSKKNLTHIHLPLKGGNESICLQQSAQIYIKCLKTLCAS